MSAPDVQIHGSFSDGGHRLRANVVFETPKEPAICSPRPGGTIDRVIGRVPPRLLCTGCRDSLRDLRLLALLRWSKKRGHADGPFCGQTRENLPTATTVFLRGDESNGTRLSFRLCYTTQCRWLPLGKHWPTLQSSEHAALQKHQVSLPA